MKKTIFLIGLGSLSCQNSKDKVMHTDDSSKINKTTQMQTPEINILKLSNFETSEKKFGPPTSTNSYLLNEIAITEFRINLLNIYKKEDFLKPIQMLEATWEVDSSSNLTIWYEKKENNWIPVDSFLWNKTAQF